jgi:hypothetical protein
MYVCMYVFMYACMHVCGIACGMHEQRTFSMHEIYLMNIRLCTRVIPDRMHSQADTKLLIATKRRLTACSMPVAALHAHVYIH